MNDDSEFWETTWCPKCEGDVWLTSERLHDGTWATVTVCQKCGHRVINLPPRDEHERDA